ncbi:MAG: WYL domain-containing protein [Actinobacteria bacterium]|nr:WYL domain-containing protein [Actinomycetota bacterium]
MSKTMHRLTRILSMVPWVIANPGATVQEVCDRFGYSRSTLIKDLDLVFVCGLPGYGPGDLMIAYVDEEEVVIDMADYFSHSLRLSASEALALVAAAETLIATEQAPPALQSAVDKLTTALGISADETLAIEIEGEPALVTMLRDAAADGRVIDLTYTSLNKGETTRRPVEPWSVFLTMGNWYLSGFCRSAGAERVFRVDRIRSAVPTEERFIPNPEPPPPVLRYTPSEDDVRATIRLEPRAAWVADYYPVDIVSTDPFVIRFSASDPSVAARLLVRLGKDAELLEGVETAAATASLRRRVLARYEVTISE